MKKNKRKQMEKIRLNFIGYLFFICITLFSSAPIVFRIVVKLKVMGMIYSLKPYEIEGKIKADFPRAPNVIFYLSHYEDGDIRFSIANGYMSAVALSDGQRIKDKPYFYVLTFQESNTNLLDLKDTDIIPLFVSTTINLVTRKEGGNRKYNDPIRDKKFRSYRKIEYEGDSLHFKKPFRAVVYVYSDRVDFLIVILRAKFLSRSKIQRFFDSYQRLDLQ